MAFERYVDAVVVHAATHGQAERLRSAIAARMVEVGLELHPDKTRIVYCKDDNRRGTHVHTSFTFLGYTFRTRSARSKHGRMFAAFLPAVSRAALVAMGRQVRRWRIHLRVGANLADLARWMNPIVRGWMHTTGGSTARWSSHCCGASKTPTWCAGPARSTGRCTGSRRPRPGGRR